LIRQIIRRRYSNFIQSSKYVDLSVIATERGIPPLITAGREEA